MFAQRSSWSLLAVAVLATCAPALGQTTQSADVRAREIAPFIHRDTFVVVCADVSKLDLGALTPWIVERYNATPQEQSSPQFRQARNYIDLAKAYVSELRKAGMRRIYVMPPLDAGVVPLTPGADAQAITAVFRKIATENDSGAGPLTQVVGRSLVLGSAQPDIDAVTKPPVAASPDLSEALAAVGSGDISAVLLSTQALNAIMKKDDWPPPEGFGHHTMAELAAALKWVAVSVDLPPKPRLQLVVRARDVKGMDLLTELGDAGLAMAKKDLPGMADALPLLQPKIDRRQLTLTVALDPDQFNRLVSALFAAGREKAAKERESATTKP